MKLTIIHLILLSTPLLAQSEFKRAYNEQRGEEVKETEDQIITKHADGSKEVADEQDSLAADVQELIQEETNERVIKFLEEAEELMAGATDRLEEYDTSGATIAIETEIIEKIADAAKQKQQSGQGQGKQPQGGGLLEMMQQMMEGNQQGQGGKPGDQSGSSAGQGQKGESDAANSSLGGNGDVSGNSENRKLPKKAGSAGTSIPKEFQKALDAYNKALNDS